MDEKQKKTLQREVMGSIFQGYFSAFQLDSIMRIIKKHVNMQSYQDLQLEIENYLDGGKDVSALGDNPGLKELLPRQNIGIVQNPLGWREAIKIAALPLLVSKSIEYSYVEAILDNIVENRPYLMVADNVIIAHAGIDKGVHSVGFSVLILPEVIKVFDYLSAKVIVVLATPDYESHLTALDQLIQLLEDPEKLQIFKNAASEDEILEIL